MSKHQSEVNLRRAWTKDEDKLLLQNYEHTSKHDLHEIFPSKTWNGIKHRAWRLNLICGSRHETMPLSETGKAYLAGLFDGEGCISVKRRKVSKHRKTAGFQLYISLGMTYRWAPMYLQFVFGGRVRKRLVPNRLPFYEWSTWAFQAEEALKELYPYLFVKRQEAKLGLILRSIRCTKRPMAPELMNLQEKVVSRIKQCKRTVPLYDI